MPLLSGEVSSSEAMMTERFFIREEVPALKAAGVDGVNISLDAADPETALCSKR